MQSKNLQSQYSPGIIKLLEVFVLNYMLYISQNLPKGEGETKCNDTICDCKRPSGLKPPQVRRHVPKYSKYVFTNTILQKIPNRASVEPKNSTKPQKAVSTETTAPKPIETQTSEIPITKSILSP